jgi:hypothetical protein
MRSPRLASRWVALASVPLVIGLLSVGCGPGAVLPPRVSAACNAAWTANEKPGGGGQSDELMAVTFRACSTSAEWKAGFAAHPLAHGSAVDPEVFPATRCSNSESDLGDVGRGRRTTGQKTLECVNDP